MSSDTRKTRAEEIIRRFEGRATDAHYLAYFECFNQQLYFEAHEVLEKLWLPQRSGPEGAFYKGLIQLAGAFVHFQKNRYGPADSLLRLAQTNLEKYPTIHHSLDVVGVLEVIQNWREKFASAKIEQSVLLSNAPPKLFLMET
jgi:predicted metal-dependent hydrolase